VICGCGVIRGLMSTKWDVKRVFDKKVVSAKNRVLTLVIHTAVMTKSSYSNLTSTSKILFFHAANPMSAPDLESNTQRLD
jgi:hypothetical protein